MRRIVVIVHFLLLVLSSINAQIVKADHDDSYKYGFKDKNDNWIVSPQYSHTHWYDKWKVGTFNMGVSCGLLDEWGNVIFPIGKYTYYYVYDKKDEKGSRYVELTDMDGKLGLATLDKKIIVPCAYTRIDIASIKDYGIIKAKEGNGLQCVYDVNGNKIIPAKYADYNFYHYKDNGVIEVKNEEGLKGLIKADGTEIVPCAYMDINLVDIIGNGLIKAKEGNGLQCVYDINGKMIIPAKYTDYNFYYYEEYGVIVVKNEEGLQGFVNSKGKELIPCVYTGLYILEGDPNIICTNHIGKMGVINRENWNVKVPFEYESVRVAADGIYLVNKGGHKENGIIVGGKWGYYANGKEIIQCIYDEASIFNNDVAKVKKDGEVTLIKNPLKDASQIQIASGDKSSDKKRKGPVVSRYPAPDSDVDKNIPAAKESADNTFAFIIANENYPDAPVPYSLNDGRMFKEYCQKALGLPEKNINLYEDATFGNIITAVEKMKSIADAYDGEASVIFYYAGHGFPDEKQSTAYLLPIDGNATDITTTGYSLAKLYKELSEQKLKSSIVFLDACFSGTKREDQMLSEARGVAIKVKEEAPQGNMLVFSAAQGDETAHQMEEKHHGLFTYYLLKELQATGGDVDMGTLTEYVTKQVKRQSVVINNKKQTPTVIPSQSLTNSWQTMKLK